MPWAGLELPLVGSCFPGLGRPSRSEAHVRRSRPRSLPLPFASKSPRPKALTCSPPPCPACFYFERIEHIQHVIDLI